MLGDPECGDTAAGLHELLGALVRDLPVVVFRNAPFPPWTIQYLAGDVASVTGYRRSTLLNDATFAPDCLIYPDDRARLARVARELVRDKGSTETTFRCITPGQNVRSLRGRCWTPLDEHGQPVAIEGIVLRADQSTERAATATAPVDADRLCRGVRDVVHDVNNLLCLVACCIDEGAGELPAQGPSRRRVGMAREAAARAACLLRSMVADASTLTRGDARGLVELDTTVQGLVPTLEQVAGPNIRVAVLPGSSTARVFTTGEQVVRLLLNLVTNARDAMQSTGEILIRTTNLAGHVLLSVTDTGPGIDPETLDRMFQRGFSTKAGPNRGLGLSIVDDIALRCGGFVDVETQPGVGSTFHVYLPCAE